ncbi:MAG: hypothetical protein IJZ86_01175 [Bacteroides sp.]|nr:hypothetical protein [Bacteroides sp.]
MAMDLTTPIDITAVIGAVKRHKDLLTTLDAEEAGNILRHFTPIPDVKDSITLGRTTLGKISRKYTGQFIGQVVNGKVVPRTLKVYPCVMEMDDEPERYRRTYITEVKGGLYPKEHPFEIWLNNYGIKCASKDLHDVMLTASYDADLAKSDLATAFDGILTIVEKEKTEGNISVANGNMYATGTFAREDVGTKLLELWRHMPSTFKKKGGKMFISEELGELYDDWLDDQGVLVTGSGAETAGQQFLRNTKKKCELIRLSGMPDGSQFVMLTTKENVCFGYDKEGDFRRMIPFNSGNPYHYTAAGKYVLGFEFVTIDKTEFCVNDQPVTPAE